MNNTISCVIQECFKWSASVSVQMLPYMAASYVCSSLGLKIDANRANDLHVKSMQRRERQSCGAIHANGANWAVFSRNSRKLKNLNVLTNQELALAVMSLRAEAENPKTIMEDKVIVVVCGYPELYIHLRTFTKTGINFATRLELPGRSPSHDANSRHSHLVWTHLYRQAWCLEKVVCVTWKALLAANTSVLKWLNQINTCYIWRDNVALSRGLWRTEASSKITHCKLLKIPAEGLEREWGRNKRLFWPFSSNLVMRTVFIFAGIFI